MPKETTKNYVRFRIKNPRLFIKSSFRTLDIGKPMGHQLVRAKLKKTGRWATQSVIVEKRLYNSSAYVRKITREIIKKARMY